MTEFLRILETTGPRPQRGPQKGADMTYQIIKGERSVIDLGGIGYPGLLADIPEPPKRLFVAGDPRSPLPALPRDLRLAPRHALRAQHGVTFRHPRREGGPFHRHGRRQGRGLRGHQGGA